mmetsp:Transcript_30108/g.64083  ORF Transcript_30108/g.64083 Transcript_30108/m.64083 type:complete len:412 (+) Transcript_30108:158-1393(+)
MVCLRRAIAALVLASLAPQPCQGITPRSPVVGAEASLHRGVTVAPPSLASQPAQRPLVGILAAVAGRCHCHFAGLCSCAAAVQFMDCVAGACDSGACDCSDLHFEQACYNMSATCPGVGLDCSQQRATCLSESKGPASQSEALRQDLAAMKKRKCRLEKAEKAGFLNADNRLRELEVEIQAHLEKLRLQGVEDLPNMSCGAGPAGAAPIVATAPPGPQDEPSSSVDVVGSQLDQGWSWTRRHVWTVVSTIICYVLGVFICAFIYDKYRMKVAFPQLKQSASTASFSYGLFGCFQDWRTCMLAACCPAVRWADTVDKAHSSGKDGLLTYWQAVGLMAILVAIQHALLAFLPLGAELAGIAIVSVGVFYRQKLRRKHEMDAGNPHTYIEDCLAWTCCSCCAVAQEARQVEALR